MTTPLQRVDAYIDQHFDRFVGMLGDLCAIPSVAAQGQGIDPCATRVAELLSAVGLDAQLIATAGNPVVYAEAKGTRDTTLLCYNHYDVQPAEPFDLWHSDPFTMTRKDNLLIARGVADDKGELVSRIAAIAAVKHVLGEIPVGIKFLIEGEEEVGSTELYSFLPKHRKELACDAVVISDNGIPSLEYPALTYGLRGIAALEVRIDGPSRDLHSGLFGGSLENPAFALCQLLAQMRDKRGRITVPGFYDEVTPLSAYERKQMARIPQDDKRYAKFLGVPELTGEKGFTANERRTCRPTFEINGLTSGYQGEGSKTIVPAWASAKITLRLVPDQTPAKILAAVKKHLQSLCPPTVRLTVKHGHGGEPYLVSPKGPLAQAALRAMSAGFNREALLMREGGSIPIVAAFKKHLRADTLLLGMSLPDDNPHSPNEKFSLDAYAAGMRMAVQLWPELAAACA